MDDEWIELQRNRHGGPLEEVKAVLDEKGIACRLASTAATFDLTALGAEREADVILSVPLDDFPKARAILESLNREIPLPEDHHLRTATDADLVEILAHESEWSAYDVAHARHMAAERSIDLALVKEEETRSFRMKLEGKQASRILVVGGFLASIFGASGFLLGGVIGLGIAWSLVSMKNRTPEGVFPCYDQASRKAGVVMFWFAIISLIVGLVGWQRLLFWS